MHIFRSSNRIAGGVGIQLIFAANWVWAEVPKPTPSPTIEQKAVPEVTLAKGTWQISGLLRAVGRLVQNDDNVGFVGRNDGFTVQNARVELTGDWQKRIALKLSLEGASDVRENPNATQGRLEVFLRDAYSDVILHPAANLRIGRFAPMVDLEEWSDTEDRLFVDRSLANRGVVATDGFETSGLAVARDLGVAVRSESIFNHSKNLGLGYEIAVTNGSHEIDSNNDNDSVAASASLLAYAYGATVLLATRYNQRTEGQLPLLRDETDLQFNLAARYVYRPLYLEAQLVRRQTTFETLRSPKSIASGGYAQFMVEIPKLSALKLGYRYAILDPSSLMDVDQVQEHTIGLVFDLPSLGSRILGNYTHAVEQSERQLSNDRLEVLWQVWL